MTDPCWPKSVHIADQIYDAINIFSFYKIHGYSREQHFSYMLFYKFTMIFEIFYVNEFKREATSGLAG